MKGRYRTRSPLRMAFAFSVAAHVVFLGASSVWHKKRPREPLRMPTVAVRVVTASGMGEGGGAPGSPLPLGPGGGGAAKVAVAAPVQAFVPVRAAALTPAPAAVRPLVSSQTLPALAPPSVAAAPTLMSPASSGTFSSQRPMAWPEQYGYVIVGGGGGGNGNGEDAGGSPGGEPGGTGRGGIGGGKGSGAGLKGAPGGSGGHSGADVRGFTKPKYPDESRRLGEEGAVVVIFRVGINGKPSNVRVAQSSGHPRLDEVALKSVREGTYVPATRGGVAVESDFRIVLAFRLADATD